MVTKEEYQINFNRLLLDEARIETNLLEQVLNEADVDPNKKTLGDRIKAIGQSIQNAIKKFFENILDFFKNDEQYLKDNEHAINNVKPKENTKIVNVYKNYIDDPAKSTFEQVRQYESRLRTNIGNFSSNDSLPDNEDERSVASIRKKLEESIVAPHEEDDYKTRSMNFIRGAKLNEQEITQDTLRELYSFAIDYDKFKKESDNVIADINEMIKKLDQINSDIEREVNNNKNNQQQAEATQESSLLLDESYFMSILEADDNNNGSTNNNDSNGKMQMKTPVTPDNMKNIPKRGSDEYNKNIKDAAKDTNNDEIKYAKNILQAASGVLAVSTTSILNCLHESHQVAMQIMKWHVSNISANDRAKSKELSKDNNIVNNNNKDENNNVTNDQIDHEENSPKQNNAENNTKNKASDNGSNANSTEKIKKPGSLGRAFNSFLNGIRSFKK